MVEEITEEHVQRAEQQVAEMRSRIEKYELEMETPVPGKRPGIGLSNTSAISVRMEALVDFLMPTDGPAATAETRYSKAMFEIYFLSKYDNALRVHCAKKLDEYATLRRELLKASPEQQAQILGGMLGPRQ